MPHPIPNLDRFLNNVILEILGTYATDGSRPYFWENGFDGTTEDLFYQMTQVARGDPQGRTYCCGLTFEIFLNACERYAKLKGSDSYRLDDLTAWGVKKLKSDWFVATGKRGGPVDALIPRGLGIPIDRIQDAIPGDFVQLWRKSGSGHSVIFLRNVENGFEYWSTQPSTKGIGKRIELFDSVKEDELYIARAFVPIPDQEGRV